MMSKLAITGDLAHEPNENDDWAFISFKPTVKVNKTTKSLNIF